MTWWCVSGQGAFSWTPIAYPGVWLTVIAPVITYVLALQRRRRDPGVSRSDRRRSISFFAGMATYWIATDWPIATLGAGYLASMHMTQYLLYTLVASPLILAGLPDWMLTSMLRTLGLESAWRAVTRPLVAGLVFNGVLLVTHVPGVVDTFRANQFGSMTMDIVWLASGMIAWAPVLTPRLEDRPASAAFQALYLFLAIGVLPMVPGAFITFAGQPLYRTYELAPRVSSLSVLDDQQLAGALMKVSSMFIVWPVMAVLFYKAAERDRHSVTVGPSSEPSPVGSSASGARPE